MPLVIDENSQMLYQKAKTLMPGGVNSPVRACKALKMTPLVVQKAQGAMIYDVDSVARIDYCLSWGAIIMGHAHPKINEAVSSQLNLGSSYGALCEQEIKLAELITRNMPHIEKLRFVSSGTEATMSAIRLARGYTGRKKIVKFSGNYHGHHDALLTSAGSFLADQNLPSSLGVTDNAIKDTLVLPYNDQGAIERLQGSAHEIAAIIFEPVCGNMGVVLPSHDFLTALQLFCKSAGALLIVDEVMTGFRNHFCGATHDFKIEGDLFCFGKIIGGGLPCAFFGGRQKIMDFLAPEGEVFQAGTLSGNPLAMSCGLVVMNRLLEEDVYKLLKAKAALLLDPIDEFIKNSDLKITLNRYGSMFTLFFGVSKVQCFEDLKDQDHETFIRFYKYLYENGVYLSPSSFEASFISLEHTDEMLTYTRELIMKFLKQLY